MRPGFKPLIYTGDYGLLDESLDNVLSVEQRGREIVLQAGAGLLSCSTRARAREQKSGICAHCAPAGGSSSTLS